MKTSATYLLAFDLLQMMMILLVVMNNEHDGKHGGEHGGYHGEDPGEDGGHALIATQVHEGDCYLLALDLLQQHAATLGAAAIAVTCLMVSSILLLVFMVNDNCSCSCSCSC